jgi:ribosomal protein S18 acetylase RimI-like enzyme
MSGEVRITRVGVERVEELGPLYESLHDHHAAISPDLTGMPARGAAESWARRRPRYESWLREPGAFALLAGRGSDAVGYALTTVAAGYDSWRSGDAIGELRDIAVLPSERGAGVGRLLVDRVAEELAGADIEEYRLTVLVGNEGALRFYERLGFTKVTEQLLAPTRPRPVAGAD